MLNSKEILKFSFSYNATMVESYRYDIVQKDNYYQLKIHKQQYDQDFHFESNAQLDSIDFLYELINQYKVESWNGFIKENFDCDGEGFSLKITLEDETIFSQGSNCFPEGLFDFKKQLDKELEKYMVKEV